MEQPQVPRINLKTSTPADVLAAFTNVGFLLLDLNGTPLSQTDLDQVLTIARDVHAVEQAERTGVDHNRNGFYPTRGNLDEKSATKPDAKEIFIFGCEASGQASGDQALPSQLEQHRAMLTDYRAKCHETLLLLLDQISLAFELPPTFFRERHTLNGLSALQLIHYPELKEAPDANDIRAGRHSDWGDLTLLVRDDQPGLEILIVDPSKASKQEGMVMHTEIDESTGIWIPAPNVEGTVLINAGLALEALTDGLCRAALHRVIFPSGSPPFPPRYSAVFFGNPDGSVVLNPVRPGGVVVEKPGAVTMQEFLYQRLKAAGLAS